MEITKINHESLLIKQLRQKLHQSFIEISDIQKLYKQQIELLKENYQNQIKQLQYTNQNLAQKLNKFEKQQLRSNHFFIDKNQQSKLEIQLGKYSSTITCQQSFLNSIKKNDQAKNQYLIQLQDKIKYQLNQNISYTLNLYFQIVKNIYQENQKLKEQINIIGQYQQSFKQKYQCLEKNYQEKINQLNKIKQDNVNLAQMYLQQVQKNQQIFNKVKANKLGTWKDFIIDTNHKKKIESKTNDSNYSSLQNKQNKEGTPVKLVKQLKNFYMRKYSSMKQSEC